MTIEIPAQELQIPESELSKYKAVLKAFGIKYTVIEPTLSYTTMEEIMNVCSNRLRNRLENIDVQNLTIEEFISECPAYEFLRYPFIGKLTITELRTILQKCGYVW